MHINQDLLIKFLDDIKDKLKQPMIMSFRPAFEVDNKHVEGSVSAYVGLMNADSMIDDLIINLKNGHFDE